MQLSKPFRSIDPSSSSMKRSRPFFISMSFYQKFPNGRKYNFSIDFLCLPLKVLNLHDIIIQTSTFATLYRKANGAITWFLFE
jgi:hypothetical protein